MMNKFTLVTVFILLLFVTSACKKEDPKPSDYDLQVLEEVNNHRVAEGLLPLEHNDFIWRLALGHSKYMAENETYSNHDGIEIRYEKLYDNFGFGGNAKENVSSHNVKYSAAEIVDLWLASVSHKANIEGDFTLTGISAVKSEEGTWYFTQIFYKQ